MRSRQFVRHAGKPSNLEDRVSTDVVPAPGLVDQLYAELEQKIRALRPKEDLTQLEKAFRLAAEAHKDQMRAVGRALHDSSAARHPDPGRHADGHGLPETGLLHDMVEDTSAQPGADPQRVRRRSGALRGRRHQAEQAEPVLARGAAGRERPQDAARDGERYSRHHREAGGPAAQHAHAGLRCRASGSCASRRRRSRFTRPSRTAWGWAKSAASWRILSFRIWSRKRRPN